MIFVSLIGCVELIGKMEKESIKKNAKTQRKQPKKELLALYLHHNIGKFYGNNEFRPSDIRKKLPEELQNIQAADLSNLLRSFVRRGLLSRYKAPEKNFHVGVKRRSSHETMPGLNSRYVISERSKIIERIFSIREARQFVFSFLLESGLLASYIYHGYLQFLYEIKYAGPHFATMLTSSMPQSATTSTYESCFERLYKNIKNMNDDEVDKSVDYFTRNLVWTITADDPLLWRLYVDGVECYEAMR